MLPINQWKAYQFATQNYPSGINNIRCANLIDLDEAGFSLELCLQVYGKAFLAMMPGKGVTMAMAPNLLF